MDEIYLEKEKVKIKSTEKVECALCEKEIAEVSIPDLECKTIKYAFSCPYCNGTSFPKIFLEKVLINYPKDVYIYNAEYNPNNRSNFIILKRKENDKAN
jgi:hypothetical protein